MEKNRLTSNTLKKLIQTRTAEKKALRYVESQIVSAALYYTGTPDCNFFTLDEWPDEICSAKKAYVTLNTIMGYNSSEHDRFIEGKRQIPEFFTPSGIKKIIELFILLYAHAVENRETAACFKTVKMSRQNEITEGTSIIKPLTSTTKLSEKEIMELGYGNKKNLAICKYTFHEGVVYFDMEDLGSEYLKPEEAEVLLLPGNMLYTTYCGTSPEFRGSDGNYAHIYELDVYAPYFELTSEPQEYLENIVFNSSTLEVIKNYFEELNNFKVDFPSAPKCYVVWKQAFQQLVFRELSKLL